MGNSAPAAPSALAVELPHRPQDSGSYRRVPRSGELAVAVGGGGEVTEALAAAGAVFSDSGVLLSVEPGSLSDQAGLHRFHRRVLRQTPTRTLGVAHLSFLPVPSEANGQPVWSLSHSQLLYSTTGRHWMITDRGPAGIAEDRGHTMSGYHADGAVAPHAETLEWTVFNEGEKRWCPVAGVRVTVDRTRRPSAAEAELGGVEQQIALLHEVLEQAQGEGRVGEPLLNDEVVRALVEPLRSAQGRVAHSIAAGVCGSDTATYLELNDALVAVLERYAALSGGVGVPPPSPPPMIGSPRPRTDGEGNPLQGGHGVSPAASPRAQEGAAAAAPTPPGTPPVPVPAEPVCDLSRPDEVRFRARDAPHDVLSFRIGRLEPAAEGEEARGGSGIVAEVLGTQWQAQVESLYHSGASNSVSFPQELELALPQNGDMGAVLGGLQWLCGECRVWCSLPGGESAPARVPPDGAVSFVPAGEHTQLAFRRGGDGSLTVDAGGSPWIDAVTGVDLDTEAGVLCVSRDEMVLLPEHAAAATRCALQRLCRKAGVPWHSDRRSGHAEALDLHCTGVYQGLSGRYLIKQGASAGGYPVWRKSAGNGWLYTGDNGRWYVTGDEADIALCAGDLASATPHRGHEPEEVDWQWWDGDQRRWMFEASIRMDPVQLAPAAVAVLDELRGVLFGAGEDVSPRVAVRRWAGVAAPQNRAQSRPAQQPQPQPAQQQPLQPQQRPDQQQQSAGPAASAQDGRGPARI